jgi:hypothetical protein
MKCTAVVSALLFDDESAETEGSETRFLTKFRLEMNAQLPALPPNDPVEMKRLQTMVDEEDLQAAISRKIRSLKHTFLVIDDLDILWTKPDEYGALEEELSWLQKCGMKIMTTSRVPFLKSTNLANCDVQPDDHQNIDIWWQCALCVADEFYICDPCKENGHGCPKP